MSDWRGEWFWRSGTCVWTFPFPCHNRLGVTEGRQDKRHTAINKCTAVYKHIIKKETLINILSGLGDPKSFQRYAAISLCCWGFHMPQYKTTFFWNSGISVYMVRRHNHCESISNTTRNSPKKNLQNYLQQATASCACVSELSGRDFMHITWTPWVIPMVKWRPPDSLHLWHVLSASCANCQLINQHHFNKIRNACFRASFLIASISPFLWLLFCIQGPEMWGEELKGNQECTNWKIKKGSKSFFLRLGSEPSQSLS